MEVSSCICVKVHCLSQELSDLLLESPLDDSCKVNTITNAVKKTGTDFKMKDRLKISSALQNKSARKLTSFETRKLV